MLCQVGGMTPRQLRDAANGPWEAFENAVAENVRIYREAIERARNCPHASGFKGDTGKCDDCRRHPQRKT